MPEGDKITLEFFLVLYSKERDEASFERSHLNPDRRAFIQQKVSGVCKMNPMFSTTFSEEP